jgi:hypothetical protein
VAEAISGRELVTRRLDGLGRATVPRGVSADAVVQIALQLASAAHFGRLLPTVQPVQTRRFRGGRFDGFMTVTPESRAFVEAHRADPRDGALPGLLRAALDAHVARVANSRSGYGWHSHVNAMGAMRHPHDRVRGVAGEEPARRLLARLDPGVARLVKWDVNAATVPALPGVAAVGNVGVMVEMMAVAYLLGDDAATIDVRADGAFAGHAAPLVDALARAVPAVIACLPAAAASASRAS